MAKISLFLTLLFCFIDVSSTFAYWMAEGKRRFYIRRGSKALFMTLEVLIPYVKYEISVTGCGVLAHCPRSVCPCSVCPCSVCPLTLCLKFPISVDDPGLGHIGLKISVGDPDPEPDPDLQDPHIFGPPGSGSGSISQRYGSGSFPFLIKVLSSVQGY